MQLYIFKYDDDEWDNVLVKDPAWTRGETDYLLELCELFDLRFLIIADRYAVGNLLCLPLVSATWDQLSSYRHLRQCTIVRHACVMLTHAREPSRCSILVGCTGAWRISKQDIMQLQDSC